MKSGGVVLGVRVLGRRGPVLLNISLVLAGLPVIADTGGATHDVGVLAVRLQEYNRQQAEAISHFSRHDSPSQPEYL